MAPRYKPADNYPDVAFPKDEPEKSCCSRGLQAYLVFITNIVICACAVGVVCLSVWCWIQNVNLFPLYSMVVIIIIFAVGVLAFLLICLSILGCFGSTMEHQFIIKLYCIFIGCLMICQFCLCAAAIIHREAIDDNLNKSFNHSMTTSYGKDEALTSAIDKMQKELHCCSTIHYSQWAYTVWNSTHTGVPESCCKTIETNCGTLAHPNNVWEHGCLNQVYTSLREQILWLVAALGGLMIIEFLAFIFGLFLHATIKRELFWEWY